MTRFQKLAATSVGLTFLLVVVGVVVRSTDSGMGCPDWPLCHGQVIPAADDYKAWFEWVHRLIASVVGLVVVATAFFAWRDHRRQRSIVWPSLAAIVLVGFQAYLGMETVAQNNVAPSVTAHLATAMALLALLIFILVRSFYPARIAGRGASQRFTLLAAFGAITTYALLLFGSQVSADDKYGLVFPDWPTMNGTFFPPITSLTEPQVYHRYAAVVVGLILLGVWIAAVRTQRQHRRVVALATIAALFFPVQAIVGAIQIWTKLAPWSEVLHLALGATVWGAAAALTFVSYYTARTTRTAVSDAGGVGTGEVDRTPAKRTVGDTVRAYIALTKPRIIELLLITTVPAMILAARGIPRLDLIFWTLLGGALAAGSANAINCYIDRDIDLLMARTRRRPLPAHDVEPERAVVFGAALGVLAFFELWLLVNLLSAFLAMLAIGFYVIVYTKMLKRTTPQNIVIGGAAGALPPVIGWAAVTNQIGVPALVLFALVFYWTPPHFWALSLRIAKDYAAAGVPMLPVVRGVPETTKQIVLYTLLLVAISLLLFAVAGMGLVYLAAAVILGGMFLYQVAALRRDGTTARAIKVYKSSMTYLALLFAAIALDALTAHLL